MLSRVLVACAVLAGAAPASAEVFIDAFAGKSFTRPTDLTLRANGATVAGQAVPAQLRVDLRGLKPRNSVTYGGRIGFWAGNVGIAVDASTLNPDLKARTVRASANLAIDESVFGEPVSIGTGDNVAVDLPRLPLPTTVTLAGLAMVRAPIGRTAQRREGVIVPYAFGGPVWLVTNRRFDGKIGLRAGGGLRLPLGRHLAIFGEYRYTAVNGADVDAGRFRATAAGITGDSGRIVGRLDVRNHTAVGGASISL